MKISLYIPIILILILSGCITTSDPTLTYSTLNIVYSKKINIAPKGDVGKITIVSNIPDNYPLRQEVISSKYSIEPSRIFKDQENRYAEFIIDSPANSSVIYIEYEMVIYKYDKTEAINNIDNVLLDNNLNQYLISEPYIQTTSKPLIEVAETLKSDDDFETVENIYNFVKKHLYYGGYEPGEIGAYWAFKNGYGDCTEYSDLFITLCRINNIPARMTSGLIVKGGTMIQHSWAEVYNKDIGWYPVDPTWGDSDYKTKIDFLRNNYIYLSFKRTDKVLNNYWFDAWWWEKGNLSIDIDNKIDIIETNF